MITVCCPLPTYIASVVTENGCPFNFGQIQKLIFWRHGNSIASVATAEVEATWTVLLSATNDTKAVVTPYTSGGALVPGEARSYGSGNEVLNGIPRILGSEPSAVNARFLQIEPEQTELLKKLMCEDLDVVLVNENGQFGYKDVSGVFYGLHIAGLFVGDYSLPGYSEPSGSAISFMIPSNEMDKFRVSDATDFALTMLNS